MAVSSGTFPPRNRRPPPASFLSPKLSGHDLLCALHSLSLSISALRPLRYLLRQRSSSIISKCTLLSFLFEDLLRRPIDESLSRSRHLCFEEMFIVLQRIKTLVEDCSAGSQTWLLMQIEPVTITFRELTSDLCTLLEILNDLRLGEDVEELKALVIKQCREDRSAAAAVDPAEESLRIEVVSLLDSIKRGIVPDHKRLEELFGKLGLTDSASCREEIERLDDEIQNLGDDRSMSESVALIGVVRYAMCVLFSASISESGFRRWGSTSELVIPADFRCPITLDLMRDPVTVATGQTYDRSSIDLWIESGQRTCPKTGQTLAHTNLIPNLALKCLIGRWCRRQRLPYPAGEARPGLNSLMVNKTAVEATKMTASFMVNKLRAAASLDAMNGVVYELRALAKMDSESRACIGEAGAVPMLARHLGSDHPSLQVNAVTTLLNLSIHDANKTRIMEAEGALNGIVEVLRQGTTWEAKGNAAATIFSLCGMHLYRKKLGKKTRVLRGLLNLAREGPIDSKKDALVAILSFANDKETAARLVEEGVMDMVNEVADDLPEAALEILEMVVKRAGGGGGVAVAAAASMMPKLAKIMRGGTSRARETAAATLVIICRKGGAEMVAELARVSMIEAMMWELIHGGTARAKRKATSLVRILHRWAAAGGVEA
ncbi:hypothetical protein Dimus_034803 [Dionaea muscipula]